MMRKYWLNRWMPICLALELHSFQILTQHRTFHRVCVSSSSVVMQSFTLSHSLSFFRLLWDLFIPLNSSKVTCECDTKDIVNCAIYILLTDMYERCACVLFCHSWFLFLSLAMEPECCAQCMCFNLNCWCFLLFSLYL